MPSIQNTSDTNKAPEFYNADSAPVAILTTPKTGNLWLRFCLERALHLISVNSSTDHEIDTLLATYSKEQPANPFIFHAHLESTEARRLAFAAAGVNVVTLLRHPIDIFLSLRRHHRRHATSAWPDVLLLNDDTTEEYVDLALPAQLAISASWARADFPALRYEELLRAPRQVYNRLLDAWHPGRDHAALAAFMSSIGTLDMVRDSSDSQGLEHFSIGRAGQWKWEENRATLAIFKRNSALRQIVEDWGYSTDPEEVVTEALNESTAEGQDPLYGVSAFDNGVPFGPFLKIVYYFHYHHKTGDFDHQHAANTGKRSFFEWLTRPHSENTCSLNNIEYEVIRFRRDVLKAFTRSKQFEYNSFRQWLHVYGARDLKLPLSLLHQTALAIGRLK